VAGSGPTDVWAAGVFAGGGAAVGRWNGRSWSEQEVLPAGQGTKTSVVIQSVWANNPDDAWAVGASADGAAMLRWNGAAWARVSLSPPSGILLDPVYGGGFGRIWGSGPNDVWTGAVDSALRPILFHFDGTAVKLLTNVFSSEMHVALPLLPPTGFSGTGPSDVWAVEPGPPGQIVHWDGAAWSIKFVGSGTFQPLATWGSGPDDVWVVGASGTTDHFVTGTGYVAGPASNLVHWDGKDWSLIPSGTTAKLSAIWGSGPGDVWAVGDGGTIVRWNGQAWSPVASGTTDALLGIWGSGPDDVWAVLK
jgi:hypothetical protein